MKAIINGVEGPEVRLFKGGDEPALNVVLLSDAGAQLDLTADTLTLEFYTKKDRSVTSSLSAAGVIAIATAGSLTVTLTSAQLNFGPGTYYGFMKRVENVGSTVEFSNIPATLIIQ
jgi:hypothetical protein